MDIYSVLGRYFAIASSISAVIFIGRKLADNNRAGLCCGLHFDVKEFHRFPVLTIARLGICLMKQARDSLPLLALGTHDCVVTRPTFGSTVFERVTRLVRCCVTGCVHWPLVKDSSTLLCRLLESGEPKPKREEISRKAPLDRVMLYSAGPLLASCLLLTV